MRIYKQYKQGEYTMTLYKQFIDSNPEIKALFEQFVNLTKAEQRKHMATMVGQIARVSKGKNAGFTGKVEFIGLTKYDRMHGTTDLSILLKNEAGESVWTKAHNTQVTA
jgi:ribosomal protein S4E